jgi:hypothetical protein
MTRILACALLVLATPLLQGQQRPQNPPYGSPPTFPDNRPERQQPPALPEQQKTLSSADIETQLQQSIAEDPALNDAKVQAKVDEDTITLTGTVQDDAQHRRVLATVEPYAGPRKIVDKLVVKKTA